MNLGTIEGSLTERAWAASFERWLGSAPTSGFAESEEEAVAIAHDQLALLVYSVSRPVENVGPSFA